MKNDTINFVLICIAYFAIGLILAGNYVQDKTLKLTQDTVETLIKIEMITKEQFSLLEDKVERLQNNNLRKIVNN
jgi:hypothetical protein